MSMGPLQPQAAAAAATARAAAEREGRGGVSGEAAWAALSARTKEEAGEVVLELFLDEDDELLREAHTQVHMGGNSRENKHAWGQWY